MLSRRSRVALLGVRASKKYGATIRETSALLEDLIGLMRTLDPVPKREQWPKRILVYLYADQNGICPACNMPLPRPDRTRSHVDHVVPWAQGGDNAGANLRLLHARCNLLKSDACNPDDVIRHLEGRLLNLRCDPNHQIH